MKPSVEFRESYLEALEEHRQERLYAFLNADELRRDFDGYVQKLLDLPPVNPLLVPQTIYWGIDEEGYAGRIALRHRLNEGLKILGGHIGYDVRPSRRRRGYAAEMLRQVLAEARKLDMDKVLITCDDDNVGSYRTAESAGALLEKTCLVEGHTKPVRYYWIDLLASASSPGGEIP